MITGSSTIQNIHTAISVEPNIRATLKYNSFVGRGYRGDVDSLFGEDSKSVLFNNKIVVYDNNANSAIDQYIITYDGGGSILSRYGISVGFINGVSWNNDVTRLQRGDFHDEGATLDLYFLKTGNTGGSADITKTFRVSSNNGVSWSGATIVDTTVSIAYDYDIAIGSSRDIYTMAFDNNHDIIRYGNIGAGRSIMYTDLFKTGVFNLSYKRLNLLEFDTKRYLAIESGKQNTITTSETTYNPAYSPFIKLMQIGLTSIYDSRNIASVGYGEDGLKLVYGGVKRTLEDGVSIATAYFGINRYNREIQQFTGDMGTWSELSTIDTTNVLCKLNSEGELYQRVINIENSAFSSLCIGGVSNIQDLTVLDLEGEFSIIFYPFYETYGSSTNLSNDILSYTNNDNKRVSLELGNIR